MKKAELIISQSFHRTDRVSLRNREGGDPRLTITNADFNPWDKVVLILEVDFNKLLENQNETI